MMRTWQRSTFCGVRVAMLSRFSANTTLEATNLANILDAAGPDAPVVSGHGSPHVLMFSQTIWQMGTVQRSGSTPRLISGC